MPAAAAPLPRAFPGVARLAEQAVAARVAPAVVVEVGDTRGPAWCAAFGRLRYDPEAAAATPDTIFDLASLTKVLCTALVAERQVERGALDLDEPVAARAPGWAGADRAGVTIRDLLSHCSGLPAHAELFRTCGSPAEFEQAICAWPLAYAPGSRALYSDLGFILLGRILARDAPLDVQFDALAAAARVEGPLAFRPPAAWRARTAPTEVDAWRGRLLVGEVHDENAWALGGVAAHAGLFGTAGAVGALARALLQVLAGGDGPVTPATLRAFVTRRPGIPGSSRALGWDTMVPTASCGRRLSPSAFGHTGFTGTSLWIDPDRSLYVVLLTNRVHPTRDGQGIGELRAAVHDAVVDAIESD